MTSEQRVKQVYPDARLEYSIRSICVFSGGRLLGERVGYNRQDRQAWADAWRNIQKQKEGKHD